VLIPPTLVTDAGTTADPAGGQHRFAGRPPGDDLGTPAPGDPAASGSAVPGPEEAVAYPRRRSWQDGPPQPVPGTAPVPGAAAVDTHTESGLPVRVRQANLPDRAPPPPTASGEEGPRDPEEVLRKMRSYQSGTMRGRTDAALVHSPDPDPDPDPAGQPR
jgi:hypothetical protein